MARSSSGVAGSSRAASFATSGTLMAIRKSIPTGSIRATFSGKSAFIQGWQSCTGMATVSGRHSFLFSHLQHASEACYSCCMCTFQKKLKYCLPDSVHEHQKADAASGTTGIDEQNGFVHEHHQADATSRDRWTRRA